MKKKKIISEEVYKAPEVEEKYTSTQYATILGESRLGLYLQTKFKGRLETKETWKKIFNEEEL